MRLKLYLGVCLLFMTVVSNASHIHRLSGTYYSEGGYHSIRIKSRRYGVKIKGFQHHHGWTKFVKTGYKTFESRYGDILKVKTYHNRVVRLDIINDCGSITSYYKYYEDAIDDHCRFRSDVEDYYRNDDEWGDAHQYGDRIHRKKYIVRNKIYSNSGNYRESSPQDFTLLEGTYRADDDRIVLILSTRDGFKARFKQDYKWKNYHYEKGKYYDGDNNYYAPVEDGQLVWTGYKSGRQIHIHKINNRVIFD